ncbi:MAG: hypothetical protein A3C35_01735 [Omnitrophica bacterium RIFCSPHIGHO2_02_FULL_46_11]|nr:MAG: hypothetical protein A3C35_01735 [Omnitrophica bacterium RIFCSPHIGHO2_02_FULL_46_11]
MLTIGKKLNCTKNTDQIRTQAWCGRLILLSALLCLPFSSFLQALNIPEELAQTSKHTHGPNGKTVFLIQEAHVQYEVQKKISDLLRFLIDKESLKLILVEGGWGRVSLSYLRNYGTPEARLKIAERYLKEGKISGEEFLDLTSKANFNLWGVENADLYANNMKAYLNIESEQAHMVQALNQLEHALKLLAVKMLPEDLLEFEAKRQSFQEGETSLIDYLKFLKSKASGINLEPFSSLTPVFELIEGTAGFDLDKIEIEKKNLTNAISKKFTRYDLSGIQLEETNKEFRAELQGIDSLLAFHEKYRKQLKALPVENLAKYAVVLKQVSEIDPEQIFQNIDLLETEIATTFSLTADQAELNHILNASKTIQKLFALELGPEEFQNIKKGALQFEPKGWRTFLETQISKCSIEASLPDLNKIEPWISLAQNFYTSAIKREEALIQNTIQKIEAEHETQAALIVGGFHREQITRALSEKGFSVIVLSPKFEVLDSKADHDRYLKILKYKWNGESAAPANFQSQITS